MSKGSAPRPVQIPMDKFNENFDRIFGKKKEENSNENRKDDKSKN